MSLQVINRHCSCCQKVFHKTGTYDRYAGKVDVQILAYASEYRKKSFYKTETDILFLITYNIKASKERVQKL